MNHNFGYPPTYWKLEVKPIERVPVWVIMPSMFWLEEYQCIEFIHSLPHKMPHNFLIPKTARLGTIVDYFVASKCMYMPMRPTCKPHSLIIEYP